MVSLVKCQICLAMVNKCSTIAMKDKIICSDHLSLEEMWFLDRGTGDDRLFVGPSLQEAHEPQEPDGEGFSSSSTSKPSQLPPDDEEQVPGEEQEMPLHEEEAEWDELIVEGAVAKAKSRPPKSNREIFEIKWGYKKKRGGQNRQLFNEWYKPKPGPK